MHHALKTTLLLLLTLCLSPDLRGQMFFDDGRMVYAGDSTVEGSYLALGINPANLGRVQGQRKGGTVLQVGGNFYSDGLDFGQVLDLTFTDQALSPEIKRGILDQNALSGDDFVYDGNLDVNWLSYSYATPTLGGIAVTVQDRVASTATVPNDALGVLLLGGDAPAVQQASSPSDIYGAGDGTDISYSHIRSVRLGYGRMLARVRGGNGKGNYRNELFRLYAGVGINMLWGIGYFRGGIEEGQFTSVAAFSDLYRVNYAQFNIQDPNTQRQLLSSVGQGFAFDLGLGLDIGDKLSFGASVVDVGSLVWDQNVLGTSVNFATIVDSAAQGLIDSYQMGQEVGNLYELVEQRPVPSFETFLNAQVRLNAAYRITERMRVGGDLVMPLRSANPETLDVEAATITGSFSWAIVPRFIYLSSGFIYNGSFGARMPLALSVNLGGRSTLNVSTADLLTLGLRENPLASLTLSFSGL